MRIVLVVPGGVDRSGRERVIPALLWLIERLARRHQVLVVALRQEPKPCRYSLLGAEVVNLGHVSGRVPGTRLLQRLHRLRTALAATGGGIDVLHGFWTGNAGLLAGLAGRLFRVPVVVSIWGGELVWLPHIGYGGQGSWPGRARVALALRLATVVTAGSRHLQPLLAGQRVEATWLPIGAAVPLFDAPVVRPAGPPWRLLQVASLNHVKGPAMLLQALQVVAGQWPGVRLDWVGEDTLGGAVQQMAASLGLADVVKFYGFQPIDAVARLYRHAHLYVQSSLHEGQGVAVCEAAAAGVPTVGTAVGLVAELAPDAAWAVAVDDTQALAEGILALLADRQRRERLGHAAQVWTRKYDADWTAAQFETIYERLCT